MARGSITDAALTGIKLDVMRASKRDPTYAHKLAMDYLNGIQMAGASAEFMSFAAKTLGVTFGGAAIRGGKPKGKPGKGLKSPKASVPGDPSAPSGYRPPGPDAATDKSRNYWMQPGLKPGGG